MSQFIYHWLSKADVIMRVMHPQSTPMFKNTQLSDHTLDFRKIHPNKIYIITIEILKGQFYRKWTVFVPLGRILGVVYFYWCFQIYSICIHYWQFIFDIKWPKTSKLFFIEDRFYTKDVSIYKKELYLSRWYHLY